MGRVRPSPRLFIARVVRKSMNRRIPNGAYCVFRQAVGGPRKVVLVQHRDISDPETGREPYGQDSRTHLAHGAGEEV